MPSANPPLPNLPPPTGGDFLDVEHDGYTVAVRRTDQGTVECHAQGALSYWCIEAVATPEGWYIRLLPSPGVTGVPGPWQPRPGSPSSFAVRLLQKVSAMPEFAGPPGSTTLDALLTSILAP